MEEKEKKVLDFLKKVSPGSGLRMVLDDLIRSDLGALIVLDNGNMSEFYEGGFRINCRFTPQRLFELCKMDGAVVISSDLTRILYGNVLLTPDKNITTNETGTRHKAAEKLAKQAKTFVIAVSERRKKITIYYSGARFFLRQPEEILRGLTNSLQILEKQREQFNEIMSRINLLEISQMVSVSDVCKILQRGELIMRISESMKKEIVELGREGSIIQMRFRELTKGVEKKGDEIVRDYSPMSLKKTKLLMSSFTFESLLDSEPLARLIFQKDLDENISPRGFRFLDFLGLTKKESSLITSSFKTLSEILDSPDSKMEEILKSRALEIKKWIIELKEQILEGKISF